MTGSTWRAVTVPDRLPPLALAALGVVLAAVLGRALLQPSADDPGAWLTVLLLVPAAVLVVTGIALAFDPRPLSARRALAAAALLWLLLLVPVALLWATEGRAGTDLAVVVVLVVVDGGALLALAATTPAVTSEPLPEPLGRLGAVVTFGAALVAAGVALFMLESIGLALWSAISTGTVPASLTWGAVGLVMLLPFATFGIATFSTRRAAAGTFQAQAAANRRNSLLLLVTLVGVVAATAEIIAATLTLDPVPALWAAGIAALVGLGAAVGADRFGADVILQTAGARPADPSDDVVL
jgi:hypothetical protein